MLFLTPATTAYADITHEITTANLPKGVWGHLVNPDGSYEFQTYITPWVSSVDGSRYKCANPFQHVYSSTYMEYPINYYISEEMQKYSALASVWTNEQYGEQFGEEFSETLAQIFIWNKFIKAGTWPDHAGQLYILDDYDSEEMTRRYEEWFANNVNDYEVDGVYLMNCTGIANAQPIMRVWAQKKTGTASVRKASAKPAVTDGNNRYSLANAQFAIYADEQCTQRVDGVDYLVTNEQGVSESVEMEVGTYWLKEEEAPAGYALNVQPQQFTVSADEETVITLADEPEGGTHDIVVSKRDVKSARVAQGGATLAGAEFTVRFFSGTYDESSLPEQATRTWVFASDESGRVAASSESKVSGDDLYLNDDGSVFLPAGTYAIQETKAPEGYHLEGWEPGARASYKAPTHIVTVERDGSYTPPTIDDQIISGGVRVKKVDAETGSKPQGDAHLDGATFEIVLEGNQDAYVGDELYGPGDVVMTISTNERGIAETGPRDLPYGTYTIREQEPPEGYVQNETYAKTFDVHSEGVVVDLRDNPCEDRVKRGGLSILKVSRETSLPQGQGASRISGAVFSVTLESNQAVMVNGTRFQKGDVVCVLYANERGIAQTTENLLPYGNYTVRETEAPKGFCINESWVKSFSVREDGEVHEYATEQDFADDQVIRGGLKFVKRNGVTGAKLAGIPFMITSATTGECHVVVSDDNGLVDTEAVAHDEHTNENDAAVDAQGSIDTSLLSPKHGIWFHGGTEANTQPNNELRALPYDTYIVQELRTDSNASYDLVSFTIVIEKDGEVLDHGYVDNSPTQTRSPSISTTLTHEQTGHVAPCAEQVSLVDEVRFDGLDPEESYRIEGELVYQDTGEPLRGSDGQPIQASTQFVPRQTSGLQKINFVVDTKSLMGKSVVAVERLFHDNKEVASHHDLNDAAQTVRFPSVGTTISTSSDQAESVSLTDKVIVHNLEPGCTYEVSGVLMDKETCQPYLTATEDEVHGSKSFVAKERDETIDVAFTLNKEEAAGKVLVAFEQLSRQGVVLATHEDINNQEQTARIVTLKTSLTDSQGRNIISAEDRLELVDTVTYTGLEEGVSYRLTGTLMDKTTGSALRDDDGRAITATSDFTPKNSDGTELVTFNCDARLLAGRVVVAFETLTQGEKQIASHEDIESEAQTVFVPKLGTTLTTRGGSHEVEVQAGKKSDLVDTVTYSGLQPGVPVCVVGTLMDADTKQSVNGEDGSPLQTAVDFVPEESSGMVEVTFSVDVSALEGHRLVAFETLHESSADGRTLAKHEDWDDEDQSVWIGKKKTTEKTNSSKSQKDSNSSKSTSEKTPSTGDTTFAPFLVVLAGITLIVIAKVKII